MTLSNDMDSFEDDTHKGPLGKMFGVALDPKAWGAIIYMLIAMPLGIAYFTFVVVGLSLSIPLMILVIGALVALTFVVMTRGLSWVEGFITGALLGARIPHRDNQEEEPGDEDETRSNSLWTGIKTMFKDGRTWTSMIYMAAMLPLGVGYFVLAVVGLTVSAAFMFSPAASLIMPNINFITVSPDDSELALYLADLASSPLGMVAMTIAGVILFFALLHLARGIGWLHARFAETMLVKRA